MANPQYTKTKEKLLKVTDTFPSRQKKKEQRAKSR
jgi:hypothetical protein